MKVQCDQELFNKFPSASVHGVAFERLELLSEEAVRSWKSRALQSVQESNLRSEFLVEVPQIAEWRNAFQAFGLKPSKYRSSVEQLIRRALKGEIIQTPLRLVNLYCYLSIIHRAPMGGYDFGKIQGDIAVRLSEAGEEFAGIGDQQSIRSAEGVVVYADGAGIICWGWNHRDSLRTCLNADTRRAIFFADSVTEQTKPAAEAAINSLSEVLLASGCVENGSFVLTMEHSEAEVWA